MMGEIKYLDFKQTPIKRWEFFSFWIIKGEKLRKFYKKHTKKDVDFNSIKHYKNGTKTLVFSIPLGNVNPIGASAAAMCPAIKFHRGVEDFISWYEDEYLKRR